MHSHPTVAEYLPTVSGKLEHFSRDFVDAVSGTFAGCGGQVYELDLTTQQTTLRNDLPFPGLQVGGNVFSRDAAGDRVLLAGHNCGGFV